MKIKEQITDDKWVNPVIHISHLYAPCDNKGNATSGLGPRLATTNSCLVDCESGAISNINFIRSASCWKYFKNVTAEYTLVHHKPDASPQMP
jgi:hypothetical protein